MCIDPNKPAAGEELSLKTIFARYHGKRGKEAQLAALIDVRPGTGEWPMELVETYVEFAFECTQADRDERPTMQRVLEQLRAWTR